MTRLEFYFLLDITFERHSRRENAANKQQFIEIGWSCKIPEKTTKNGGGWPVPVKNISLSYAAGGAVYWASPNPRIGKKTNGKNSRPIPKPALFPNTLASSI